MNLARLKWQSGTETKELCLCVVHCEAAAATDPQ